MNPPFDKRTVETTRKKRRDREKGRKKTGRPRSRGAR